MSAVAGCMPRTTYVEDGILTWEQHRAAHSSQGRLPRPDRADQPGKLAQHGGGTVYPPEVADEICDRAHAAGLRVHLDGARIFNAAVALGRDVAEITRKFDSVMFCLSKGLGAPVGSMLVGRANSSTGPASIASFMAAGCAKSACSRPPA